MILRNVLALWTVCLAALPQTVICAGNAEAEALGHRLTAIVPPRQAPDFTLENMDGEQVTLSDFRGQVVMLNFWATWCPPCRREIPSMEAVFQDLRARQFQVLAVNQWETAEHVFAYMGQLDVFPEFPILFDPQSEVSQDYGVKGLPTTLLIDKQGRIAYRAIGGRDFDHPEVRKIITQLLDQ